MWILSILITLEEPMIEETNTKEYIIFKRYDKIILLIEETVKVTLIH